MYNVLYFPWLKCQNAVDKVEDHQRSIYTDNTLSHFAGYWPAIILTSFTATLRYVEADESKNPARFKNGKIPVFIVSNLEIRQYICASPLQKHEIFLF